MQPDRLFILAMKNAHWQEDLQQIRQLRLFQNVTASSLQQLLRDNRNGTRAGFPFSVIDEILTLSAILEEDLGPCPPAASAGTQR